MSVASKLQIKPGQTVAVVGKPVEVDLGIAASDLAADAASAEAAVAFVMLADEVSGAEVGTVLDAARRDALAWLAYPKGGRLGTDLNRDTLAALVSKQGLRPVRQVSIDETWSALRFRPAG